MGVKYIDNNNKEDLSAPMFWSVQFEVVEGCNRACGFCGIHSIRNAKCRNELRYMDLRMVKKICTELATIKPNPRIEIDNHGEPLLHPNIVDIVRIMRTILPGASIQIATNGEAVWKPSGLGGIIQIANDLFDAGLNMFVLDAYDKEMFDTIQTNIQKVTDKLKVRTPEVQVIDYFYNNPDNVSMYNKNYGKVFFLVDDLARVMEKPDRKAAKLIINEGGNTPEKYLEHIGNEDYKYLPYEKACSRVFREITFGWNGVVPACCYDWKNGLVMGKYPEQSVLEIWNSKTANAMRYLMSRDTKFRNFSPCDVCDYKGGFRLGFLPHVEYDGGKDQALIDLREGMEQFGYLQYAPYKYHVDGVVYNDKSNQTLEDFVNESK